MKADQRSLAQSKRPPLALVVALLVCASNAAAQEWSTRTPLPAPTGSFAVGVGTSVSPGATVLGPVPGLPLFAALPDGQASFGFLVLLVPILAGFAVGVLLRQRMPQQQPDT